MQNNKLELILITFNRKERLEKTLKQLFAENSPVRNFDITVLDNCSTDSTSELCHEYAEKHRNIKYIRHEKNIGGNANIARAFEIASKEYVWVLCDDDKYDFSIWPEIASAVNSSEYDMIFTCLDVNRHYPNPNFVQIAYLAAFVPGCIYKAERITNDVMQNMYGNINTWYPQVQLSLDILFNNGGKYYIPKKSLVLRGMEDSFSSALSSLSRGRKNISPDLARMFWHVGFILSAKTIKDRKTRNKIIYGVRFNEEWRQGLFGYIAQMLEVNAKFRKGSVENIANLFFTFGLRGKIFLVTAFIISPFFYIRVRDEDIDLVLFRRAKLRVWSAKWAFWKNGK